MVLFSFIGVIAIAGDAFAVQTVSLRDPTRPVDNASMFFYEQEEEGAFGIRINSIIVATDRKIVMINGQYLREGDKINGVTVTNIYFDAIRVQDSTGERFVVKMPYSGIKTIDG